MIIPGGCTEPAATHTARKRENKSMCIICMSKQLNVVNLTVRIIKIKITMIITIITIILTTTTTII